jgi:hypothetical protein
MTCNFANLLTGLVGARGFEPRTSCAQGRRATRLRYAPTLGNNLILVYLYTLFQVLGMTASLSLCQITANSITAPKFADHKLLKGKGRNLRPK